MFPVFRPKTARKSLFPDFAIFQTEARRGGFRGPSRPVNDVVREGKYSRKRTSEKIAHSSRFRGIQGPGLCRFPPIRPLGSAYLRGEVQPLYPLNGDKP